MMPPSRAIARARDVPRRVEIALGLALAFAVCAAALGLSAQRDGDAHTRFRAAAPDEGAPQMAGRDDLAVRARRLVAPDGYLTARGCAWAQRPWAFPRQSMEQARALLAGALRDHARVEGVLAATRCDGAGCLATPPPSLVEGIPQEARARLYAELGRHPENPQFSWPFRRSLVRGPFATWPEIPDAARETIARTTWVAGGLQHFSDLGLACARVSTDEDRAALVRAFNQRETLDVELRTSPSSTERIARAFAPRERPAVRALLASARQAGLASTPLDPLLPEWVRRRVGTYPARDEAAGNCFWTALHFRDGALAAPVEVADAEADLARRYARVERGAPRFGDVMAFYDERGALVHAGVALVGGLMFTKNGAVLTQPWRIDSAEEALTDYPETRSVVLWRLRDEP